MEFTSKTRCHSSRLVLGTPAGPRIPALLTRIDGAPNVASTWLIAASTAASSATSHSSASIPGSSGRSSPAQSMSSNATRAPCSRMASAMARPMLRAAPVTTATRPS